MNNSLNSASQIAPHPIQVYLDSSDYSILSDPKKNNKNLNRIKNELISLTQRKVIEIRFSIVHVLEMAHLEKENCPLALSRFKILNELCGAKTLLSIPDMENMELVRLVHNSCYHPSTRIKQVAIDNGEWFPAFSFESDFFEKMIITELFKAFRDLKIPRNERQRLKKQLTKKGHISEKFLEYIPNGRDFFLKAIAQEYPLTDRFKHEDLFVKLIKKEITNDELMAEFKAGFFNLENFIGWYLNRSKESSSLPIWLRGFGQQQSEKIKILREKCERLFKTGIEIGKSEKEILIELKTIEKDAEKSFEQNRKNYIMGLFTKRQNQLFKLGLSKKKWQEIVSKPKLGETPSIDIYLRSIVKYIFTNATNIKYKRRILDSDQPDLMHARYLPYMNIFRADKNTGNLLKPFAKAYQTQVLTSFCDILDAINSYSWSD